MPQQQGAHSLNEAFKDFAQSYPREIVYPIFGLLTILKAAHCSAAIAPIGERLWLAIHRSI